MYPEGSDLDAASDRVGRFRLDREASEAFFEDPLRLFTDILGDVTQEWLEDHRRQVDAAQEPAQSPPAIDPR